MKTEELKTILEIQGLPFEEFTLTNRKEHFFSFPSRDYRKCEIVFDEEKNILEYTDNKRYLRTYYDFAKTKDDLLELIEELFFYLGAFIIKEEA